MCIFAKTGNNRWAEIARAFLAMTPDVARSNFQSQNPSEPDRKRVE
jgi:hypothetical protein